MSSSMTLSSENTWISSLRIWPQWRTIIFFTLSLWMACSYNILMEGVMGDSKDRSWKRGKVLSRLEHSIPEMWKVIMPLSSKASIWSNVPCSGKLDAFIASHVNCGTKKENPLTACIRRYCAAFNINDICSIYLHSICGMSVRHVRQTQSGSPLHFFHLGKGSVFYCPLSQVPPPFLVRTWANSTSLKCIHCHSIFFFKSLKDPKTFDCLVLFPFVCSIQKQLVDHCRMVDTLLAGHLS